MGCKNILGQLCLPIHIVRLEAELFSLLLTLHLSAVLVSLCSELRNVPLLYTDVWNWWRVGVRETSFTVFFDLVVNRWTYTPTLFLVSS